MKDIRDKAEAMAAYARQAKDSELIQYATEIKVRAERRCGELLARTAATGERATKAGNVNQHTARVSNDATPTTPTLADMGLTRDESSRYQQLAAMPAEHFEMPAATAAGAKLKAWHAVRAKERMLAALQAGNRTKHGKPSAMEDLPQPTDGPARDHAAKAVGVSGKLIDQAESVMRKAVPKVRGRGRPRRATEARAPVQGANP